jgi:hypothetical protein
LGLRKDPGQLTQDLLRLNLYAGQLEAKIQQLIHQVEVLNRQFVAPYWSGVIIPLFHDPADFR